MRNLKKYPCIHKGKPPCIGTDDIEAECLTCTGYSPRLPSDPNARLAKLGYGSSEALKKAKR